MDYNKKIFSTKILRFAKKVKSIGILGNKCEKCGNNNIFQLVFHHTDDTKEHKISDIQNVRWSILAKEIDKCILLCENCHRELHYTESLLKYGEGRRIDKKIYLLYKDNKCERCGYNKCEASISFHHKDPNEKVFSIGSLSERMNSIEDLKNEIKCEIDKCEILCMNCHRMEHTDIEFFNENKIEIYKKSEKIKERQSKIDRTIVYEMYDSGKKQVEIAKHFNSSKGTISDILKPHKLKNIQVV